MTASSPMSGYHREHAELGIDVTLLEVDAPRRLFCAAGVRMQVEAPAKLGRAPGAAGAVNRSQLSPAGGLRHRACRTFDVLHRLAGPGRGSLPIAGVEAHVVDVTVEEHQITRLQIRLCHGLGRG